jgi:hypothetical protein
MTLLSVSRSTANRKINLCRNALGKEAHQILTISEFREYYDIKE